MHQHLLRRLVGDAYELKMFFNIAKASANTQTIIFNMFGSSINPGFYYWCWTAVYTSKIVIRATGASGSERGYATLNGQAVAYSGQLNTLSAAINTSITQPIYFIIALLLLLYIT